MRTKRIAPPRNQKKFTVPWNSNPVKIHARPFGAGGQQLPRPVRGGQTRGRQSPGSPGGASAPLGVLAGPPFGSILGGSQKVTKTEKKSIFMVFKKSSKKSEKWCQNRRFFLKKHHRFFQKTWKNRKNGFHVQVQGKRPKSTFWPKSTFLTQNRPSDPQRTQNSTLSRPPFPDPPFSRPLFPDPLFLDPSKKWLFGLFQKTPKEPRPTHFFPIPGEGLGSLGVFLKTGQKKGVKPTFFAWTKGRGTYFYAIFGPNRVLYSKNP